MNKNILTTVLVIIVLVIGLTFYMNSAEFHSDKKKKAKIHSGLVEGEEEHYALAKAMSYLQRYSQKLYFAGEVKNWELSKFYAHEMEETIEEIEEAQVVDEGFDISFLVGAMTESALRKVEIALEKQDPKAFADSYKLLIQSCNACHQATKHEFIKIEIPVEGKIFNQKFSK